MTQQLHDFLKAFPKAKWHQYEPLARDAVCRGSVMAFGKPVNTFYDFGKADVIVSFDADFLTCGPGNLHYVADFSDRRRVQTTTDDAKKATMNRLYMVETTVSNTGAKADHRLAVKESEIELVLSALAAALKVPDVPATDKLSDAMRHWTQLVADDLRNRTQGTTLVLAGDRQSAVAHLLAQAINRHLGNVGKTVLHTPPIEAQPAVQNSQSATEDKTAPVERIEALRQLADEMDAGQVEILLILGGNPVFTAPADFHFAERMQKVRLRVHLSLFQDETSRQCHWHLPEAHYLEAWSDTRSYEGTVSIVQPLIQPLYQGRSAHDLLAALTPIPGPAGSTAITYREVPGLEIVRGYWQSKHPSGDFETFWQETVHDGVMAKTAFTHETFAWDDKAEELLTTGPRKATGAGEGFELGFYPDSTIWDGRFANNGWLQELPKPVTKLTWDNAALMSPATAKALGVGLGSYAHGGEHGGFYQPVVELQLGGQKLRAPAWIVPGQADGCIVVHLGYGRDSAGRVGGSADNKVGFNAYTLRTSDHLSFVPGLAVQRTDDTYLLACTQQHHLMENRDTVRVATLAEYRQKPDFATEKEKKEAAENAARLTRQPLTLYEPHPYNDHKWGMVIDLTACVGCNACVVACQAENNIPVVGKEQVAAGREMHWLRIDRYISGPFDQPTEFHFQPLPCMHCENAPCEYVCPVEATVHSADGLNDMVYQRCVGTRFCSNNCPYKVRRFNFFFYADYRTESTRQQYNPDVTVRSRGVMEKCSYCVQRIRHAEIDSQVEGRKIVDGEVLTACQAACPAQAIVFGDINDKKSKVKQGKDSPLNYGLLAEQNTVPRTTYLAALRNPNPAMGGE